MPWKTRDATSFTKKAKRPKAKRQFVHVANSMLEGGASDGAAIRAANGVIKKRKKKGM